MIEGYTSRCFLLSRGERKIILYPVKYILFNRILFIVQIKILPLYTVKAFPKFLGACSSVLGDIERDIIDSHNTESRIREF